ncbi:hypothetical protein [Bifidobacterium sp. ESL0825]
MKIKKLIQMISDLCHHHLHVMAIPVNVAPIRRQKSYASATA